MTPGAQAGSAIELLTRLEAVPSLPADKILSEWGRANRYAGAKDKAAVARMVYGVLRRRGQIDWWLNRCRGGAATARARLLVWLQLEEGYRLVDLENLFTGVRYDPVQLSGLEKRVAVELGAQQGFDLACQPMSAIGNIPEFLSDEIAAFYGADAMRQLGSHIMEAPVDLRVNSLKADRMTVQTALEQAGIHSNVTEYSPHGLRLEVRRPLGGLAAFQEGLFEPQDEGSQLAALLTEARPGMKVVDFCAGAGGKTLALAAEMQNNGRIIACDVSEARLKRAAQRLKRAGAFLVERRLLSSEQDKWVKRRSVRFDGGFDRVLIDAPCSGSGTWRRNPDQKWKLTAASLKEIVAKQSSILDSAARLVAPGGRLVYVTCSILKQENEDHIEKFLSGNAMFYAHPIADIWSEVFGKVPYPGEINSSCLRLTPADHGTDGFFIAVLGRKRQ